MKTRVGKIARLPKQIREQLNQRLEDGEQGKTIVQWLNGLPEIQKLIAEQFNGQPIRDQNLSEWKKGGYQDWLRHQNLRNQTRWTAEEARDFSLDADEFTISISENIAMVMSAELAIHVRTLSAITDPMERFQQFRLLCRELSRIRRDDQRVLRYELRRKQWESTLEPLESDPEETAETGPQPETPPPIPANPT